MYYQPQQHQNQYNQDMDELHPKQKQRNKIQLYFDFVRKLDITIIDYNRRHGHASDDDTNYHKVCKEFMRVAITTSHITRDHNVVFFRNLEEFRYKRNHLKRIVKYYNPSTHTIFVHYEHISSSNSNNNKTTAYHAIPIQEIEQYSNNTLTAEEQEDLNNVVFIRVKDNADNSSSSSDEQPNKKKRIVSTEWYYHGNNQSETFIRDSIRAIINNAETKQYRNIVSKWDKHKINSLQNRPKQHQQQHGDNHRNYINQNFKYRYLFIVTNDQGTEEIRPKQHHHRIYSNKQPSIAARRMMHAGHCKHFFHAEDTMPYDEEDNSCEFHLFYSSSIDHTDGVFINEDRWSKRKWVVHNSSSSMSDFVVKEAHRFEKVVIVSSDDAYGPIIRDLTTMTISQSQQQQHQQNNMVSFFVWLWKQRVSENNHAYLQLHNIQHGYIDDFFHLLTFEYNKNHKNSYKYGVAVEGNAIRTITMYNVFNLIVKQQSCNIQQPNENVYVTWKDYSRGSYDTNRIWLYFRHETDKDSFLSNENTKEWINTHNLNVETFYYAQ